MKLSAHFLAGISVVVALLLGSSAHAGPWITVTACDSVAINGVFHPRVTFSVTNASPFVVTNFRACSQSIGAPTDSCTGLALSAPPDWRGNTSVADCPSWFEVNPFETYIAPGQTLGGFQLVVDRRSCCFDVGFSNISLDPFGFDTLCFACDQPVAARSISWGQMKSQYR
jgi:hypothetical protein